MAEVQIKITAKDGTQDIYRAIKEGAKSAFDEVGRSAEKAASESTSALAALKSGWLGIYVAAKEAWEMLQEAMEYMELGAAAQQAEEAFKHVTAAYGESADHLLEKLKEVSAGVIDDSNLMQRSIKGLQQGLSGQQLVQILEVSRSAARIAGTDIASAFDNIANSIANQTMRGLKQYGLVIDQTKAFKDYAASIGVSADALTEQQQTQALANAAIAEGNRQMAAMGPIVKNASENIQQFKAAIHQLKETAGKALINFIDGVIGGFMLIPKIVTNFDNEMDAVKKIMKGIAEDQEYLNRKNEEESAITKQQQERYSQYLEAKFAGVAVEKTVAEQNLATWTTYYNELTTAHNKAIEEQKTKTRELLNLETQIKQQRQGYADLELGLRQKLMTASEVYFSTQDDLANKYDAAMLLSGQAKIDALNDWQRAAAATAREITEDGQVIVSLESAVEAALSQVAVAQEEIITAQDQLMQQKEYEIYLTKQWIWELENAMDIAKRDMDEYTTKINQATQALATMASWMNYSTGTAVSVGGGLQSGNSMAGLHDVPKLATGTPYVSKTGMFILHKGEAVVPANQNGRQSSITLAPTIHINNTGGKDGKALAQEIDREMADMIRYDRSRIPGALRAYGNN